MPSPPSLESPPFRGCLTLESASRRGMGQATGRVHFSTGGSRTESRRQRHVGPAVATAKRANRTGIPMKFDETCFMKDRAQRIAISARVIDIEVACARWVVFTAYPPTKHPRIPTRHLGARGPAHPRPTSKNPPEAGFRAKKSPPKRAFRQAGRDQRTTASCSRLPPL